MCAALGSDLTLLARVLVHVLEEHAALDVTAGSTIKSLRRKRHMRQVEVAVEEEWTRRASSRTPEEVRAPEMDSEMDTCPLVPASAGASPRRQTSPKLC